MVEMNERWIIRAAEITTAFLKVRPNAPASVTEISTLAQSLARDSLAAGHASLGQLAGNLHESLFVLASAEQTDNDSLFNSLRQSVGHIAEVARNLASAADSAGNGAQPSDLGWVFSTQSLAQLIREAAEVSVQELLQEESERARAIAETLAGQIYNPTELFSFISPAELLDFAPALQPWQEKKERAAQRSYAMDGFATEELLAAFEETSGAVAAGGAAPSGAAEAEAALAQPPSQEETQGETPAAGGVEAPAGGAVPSGAAEAEAALAQLPPQKEAQEKTQEETPTAGGAEAPAGQGPHPHAGPLAPPTGIMEVPALDEEANLPASVLHGARHGGELFAEAAGGASAAQEGQAGAAAGGAAGEAAGPEGGELADAVTAPTPRASEDRRSRSREGAAESFAEIGDLLTEYVSEQEPRLAQLEECLLALEEKAEEGPLVRLCEVLETLHADAGFLGIASVERIAGSAREYIEQRYQPGDDLDTLFTLKDRLVQVMQELAESQAVSKRSAAALEALDAVFSGRPPPAPTLERRPLEGDPSMTRDFLVEASGQLQGCRQALQALQAGGEEEAPRNLLQSTFHSLMGVAQFLGLTQLRDVAQATEELMGGVSQGEPPLSAGLLEVVAAALELLEALHSEVDNSLRREVWLPQLAQVPPFIARVQRARAGVFPPPEEEQPAPPPVPEEALAGAAPAAALQPAPEERPLAAPPVAEEARPAAPPEEEIQPAPPSRP